MARTLSSFSITADGKGDYLISIDDEDGETIELTASYDQLDMISEAIDDALDEDEEDALGVEEDEDEENEA
ncbi:hypothetical protein [Sphingomonas sp. MS122]|uniref:hypothetical protein n=1 Tax=Sphingomonas sp. MS122 TaxID=3412683 RepID=UPI003C2BABFE